MALSASSLWPLALQAWEGFHPGRIRLQHLPS